MTFDNRRPDDVPIEGLRPLGAALSRPRIIEQFFYFPTLDTTDGAARALQKQGYMTEVFFRPTDSNWLLLAMGRIIPGTERIYLVRFRMDELAATFGGKYDGWGTPITKWP
jgi:hypothetical protein